eukprot:Protomagalhaensia_sp_Gyna_25__5724@NODE_821_length_2550_cov_7_985265_g647_i0_p1_GENE_NODE_821_length_2550_cov_7_985265_g647_i0NODE_821_length_2550_cov_7_985265_g647_i0_p1_ORF_typecomplete_len753_score105_86Peptidase_C54/PF03416_19/1_3e63_NODE_821_length_2550_cov_7_985265_g647_i0552313
MTPTPQTPRSPTQIEYQIGVEEECPPVVEMSGMECRVDAMSITDIAAAAATASPPQHGIDEAGVEMEQAIDRMEDPCTADRPASQPIQESSFSYKAYLRAMSCALVNLLPFPWRARQPRCVLLGRRYDFSDLDDHEAFQSDFTSRLLFTYRHGFQPLASPAERGRRPLSEESSLMNSKLAYFFRSRGLRQAPVLTSDSGWGCMIRVFQMAVAQALMQLYFGRNWRRPQKPSGICVNRKELLYWRTNQQKGRRSYSLDPRLRTGRPSPEEVLSLMVGTELGNGDLCREASEAGEFNTDEIPGPYKTDSPGAPPIQLGQFNQDHNRFSDELYPWSLLPILKLFRDDPSARFSLHRIVAVGRLHLGIQAGAWFGPTSCSDSIAMLIAGSRIPGIPGNTPENQRSLIIYPPHASQGTRLSVYHSKHGEISRNQVRRFFFQSSLETPGNANGLYHLLPDEVDVDVGDSRHQLPPANAPPRQPILPRRSFSQPESLEGPSLYSKSSQADVLRRMSSDPDRSVSTVSNTVVIFLSFRLGLESLNLRYQPFLQSCFGMPQFQGLAGGGPLTSAYWFVAANDQQLYFLDPHSPIQPAMQELGYCVSVCSGERSRKAESRTTSSSPEVSGRPLWASKRSASEAAFSREPHRERVLKEEEWTLIPGLKINNQACSKEVIDQMFFPSEPKQLSWSALNPSMTLVFLCQSWLLFEDLLIRLQEVDSEGLISVVDEEGFGATLRGKSAEAAHNLTFDSAEDGFYLL